MEQKMFNISDFRFRLATSENPVLVVEWGTNGNSLRRPVWDWRVYAGSGKAENSAGGAAYTSSLTRCWWQVSTTWDEYLAWCLKHNVEAHSSQPTLGVDADLVDVAKAAYERAKEVGWQCDLVIVRSPAVRGCFLIIDLKVAAEEGGEVTMDVTNPELTTTF